MLKTRGLNHVDLGTDDAIPRVRFRLEGCRKVEVESEGA